MQHQILQQSEKLAQANEKGYFHQATLQFWGGSKKKAHRARMEASCQEQRTKDS